MADDTIPQERCDFYVYVLFRENGTPFYVGKGSGRRCRDHLRPDPEDRTSKAKIIRRMAAKGMQPAIVKLADSLTEEASFAIERELILLWGRHPHGPLWNLTDGGEGASGYTHTPQARQAIAVAAKAAQSRPEARKAMSDRSRDAWADPARRASMYRAIRCAITTEVRAAMTRQLRKTFASPDWRKKQAQRTRDAWASKPDARLRQGILSRARMQSAAARAVVSAAVKANWATPEGRQKKLNAWTPERRAAQAERCRLQAAIRWTPERRAAAAEKWKTNNPRRKAACQANGDGSEQDFPQR